MLADQLRPRFVVPAQAGIQAGCGDGNETSIPAFAGMTDLFATRCDKSSVALERLAARRRFDVEHSDHRADGDVVAEQADGFDELGVAKFFFHAREQVVRE